MDQYLTSEENPAVEKAIQAMYYVLGSILAVIAVALIVVLN